MNPNDNFMKPKKPMAVLLYSPPYCPIDDDNRKLWDTLLSAGIVGIKMVNKDGKLGFISHYNQEIKIEKGKFYPIELCGGMTQQTAIVPFLKDI